jgi:formylmethanofuran dehydrogenase subunit E
MENIDEKLTCPVCGEEFYPEYGELNEYGDIVCPMCASDPPIYEKE